MLAGSEDRKFRMAWMVLRHLERSTAGPWGVQTAPPETTAFLSDTKLPFWWDGERREQDENKPQQNSSSSFPCRFVPPTLEPRCCSRKTAGCQPLHRRWDRQSAKAQRGVISFYFLSKIRINTFLLVAAFSNPSACSGFENLQLSHCSFLEHRLVCLIVPCLFESGEIKSWSKGHFLHTVTIGNKMRHPAELSIWFFRILKWVIFKLVNTNILKFNTNDSCN